MQGYKKVSDEREIGTGDRLVEGGLCIRLNKTKGLYIVVKLFRANEVFSKSYPLFHRNCCNHLCRND